MNKAKRDNYTQIMTLNGIHTLSGYLPLQINPEKVIENESKIKKCNYQVARNRTYLWLNPNKKGLNEHLISSYSGLLSVVDGIFQELDSDKAEYSITRADFCFNSIDVGAFEDYKKLHRLLLSCLAKAYKYKNCYHTVNLWEDATLSIAIKKDDAEAENYNKSKQSWGADESSNRLELRSKKCNCTIYELSEVIEIKWSKQLDKAIEYFEDVQKEYNWHLEMLYKADLEKDSRDRNYLNLDAFLLQYKDCIFTRKQLIDLLNRFEEVKNPVKKANRFKERHRIEYFSKPDLKVVVRCLKEKMNAFFKN